MQEIRARIGFSLQELELCLLNSLRNAFRAAYTECVRLVDALIAESRDKRRFESKGFRTTTLETTLGEVTITRRYYLDRETGKYVFLVDETLNLPEDTRVSPALAELVLHQAVLTPSYRAAAASLAEMLDKPVLSHETVRQIVKKAGLAMEAELAKDYEAKEKRRVDVLFMEVDALHVALQRDKKRNVAEYICVIHEGWLRRTEGSKDYKLDKAMIIPAQDVDELWDRVSNFVHGHYDVRKETVIVINGDRASWIRKGKEYFPNALYQVDRYHLKRDLKRLFGDKPQLWHRVEQALESDDITGATFLAELARCQQALTDSEKVRNCQKLINDLVEVPDATVDYRKRLKARGVRVEGLRGLGASESQMSYFAHRVKGRRSWSRKGLAAMIQLLSSAYAGRLREATRNVAEFLQKAGICWRKTVKEAVEQTINKVTRRNAYIPPMASVPIAYAGRTSSGGMSNFFNRLLTEGSSF